MCVQKLKNLEGKIATKLSAIQRVLTDIKKIEKTIEDILYLKSHAEKKIFTGGSGRSGKDTYLRTVDINLISGCVKIPKLLLELAEKKLEEKNEEARLLIPED